MTSTHPKPRPQGTSWKEVLAWVIVLGMLFVLWFGLGPMMTASPNG